MAKYLCCIIILFWCIFTFAQTNDSDLTSPRITRFPPDSFPELPQNIKTYLKLNGYRIPQVYGPRKENVIHGKFRNIGIEDWAILGSKNDSSAIIIFWAGATSNITELRKDPDLSWLQLVGDIDGFARMIGVATKSEILKYYKEYQKAKPPISIDHDGIGEAFEGKGSVTLYFYKNKWINLQGSD
jgi:hypothetical protein